MDCNDFAICPAGCIDMYKVMASSGTLNTFQMKITQRYAASPQCAADLSSQFTINYLNWFEPRTDNQSGIVSVKDRWNTGANMRINEVQGNLVGLKQQLAR